MPLFLTDDELLEFTGKQRPSAQRRWLASRGYRFEVRPDGRPRLLTEQIRARQMPGRKPERPPGPDLDALG